MESFFRRHELLIRSKSRTGQESPEDLNLRAELFCRTVLEKCDELGVNGYLLKVTNILNADQTAIYFEMIPKKTVDESGCRKNEINFCSERC